jgi:hypothetical protein
MAKSKKERKTDDEQAQALLDKREKDKQEGMILVSREGALPGAIPSARTLASLFEPASPIDRTKLKKLTLPPIVKPSQVGPGVTISGKITGIAPSPVSTYKSELLKLEHSTGREFCFPLTAVVAKALASHLGAKSADGVDFKRVIGETVVISGLGAAGHSDGKRTVNLFEVYVLNKE